MTIYQFIMDHSRLYKEWMLDEQLRKDEEWPEDYTREELIDMAERFAEEHAHLFVDWVIDCEREQREWLAAAPERDAEEKRLFEAIGI